jgi:FixJ family two-component response regulator
MNPALSDQSADSIVLVVDDDLVVCDQITNLLHTVGLQSKAYASASEFLKSDLPNQASCLISDVRMPGLSGFDLHAHLVKQRINIPIIFVSGYADIPMSVKAMKAGAVEFLTKPFRDEDLLDAVRAALDRDRQRRKYEHKINDIRRLYNALTQREQEVMSFVVAGFDEQASRERNWARRGHCKSSSSHTHEKDGRKVPRRPSENGSHS